MLKVSGQALAEQGAQVNRGRPGECLTRRADPAGLCLRYTDPAPSGVVFSDGASAGSSLGPFPAFGSGQ